MQLLPPAVQRNGRRTEAVLLPALLLPQVRPAGADEGQRAVLRALLEAHRAERSGRQAGEPADAQRDPVPVAEPEHDFEW